MNQLAGEASYGGGGPLTDGPHQPQYVQDKEVVEFTTQHEQGKNQKGNNQSREQKEKKWHHWYFQPWSHWMWPNYIK